MFPALQNLGPDRIRQKLARGQTPAQITMTFVANIVTREINNKIPDSLEKFVRDLQDNLILRQPEKVVLIEHIANNDNITALDKLCGYLENKPDKDIIELIQILEHSQYLAQLGQFLRSVFDRCQAEVMLPHMEQAQGK